MNRKHRSYSQAACVVGGVIVMLMCWFGSAQARQSSLATIKLSAGIYVIQAEVASTMATRSQGLMQRKAMAQSAGMIFLFDESALHCMWMKNTLIPLSVAFIDELPIS